MYTKLLVPLDGSKLGEQILPYARFFARMLRIPVDLVWVVDPDAISPVLDPTASPYIEALVAERMHSSTSYLDALVGSFKEVTVDCAVQRGKPADVVIERAAADKDTLIAMATRGRSGIQRWLLGSVAEKVLRGASNHLLIVRATEHGKVVGETPLKNLVAPLDGSKLAEQVLPCVLDLAKGMNLEVHLLRAYISPPASYVLGDGSYVYNFDRVKEKIREEAEDYLKSKVRELQGEGLSGVFSSALDGDAAEQICDFARTRPSNLLAMSTHGRSGVQRWVLGSVTEKVVHYSSDPVLVVRAQA